METFIPKGVSPVSDVNVDVYNAMYSSFVFYSLKMTSSKAVEISHVICVNISTSPF